MTPKERVILEMLGAVLNLCGELPDVHQAEAADVAFHVHALQRIVAARASFRSLLAEEAEPPALHAVEG